MPSSPPTPQSAAPEEGFVYGSSPTPNGPGEESGTPSILFTLLWRAVTLAAASELGQALGGPAPGSPCLSDATQLGADPEAKVEAASFLLSLASPEVTALELSGELAELALAAGLPLA